MKRLMPLMFFLALIPLAINAGFPGALFLTLYPGARAVGMAGAFSAIADDAMATYYNPAGLAFQKSINLSANHNNWLPGLDPGMYYEYLSVSFPFSDKFTIAPSINYLTTGTTEYVDENGNYLGVRRSYDISIGISAGRKVFPFLGIGGTIKFIQSHQFFTIWAFPDETSRTLFPGFDGNGNAYSMALDIGLSSIHNWSLGKSSIGFAIQNMGPDIKYKEIGESGRLPCALRLGLAHNINVQTLFPHAILKHRLFEQANINIAYDIRKSLVWVKESYYSVGFEINPFPLLSLRVGYFEDISGQRGGILVNHHRGSYAEHISLIDYLFKKDHEIYAGKIGICYGIGIRYKRFQFDVGNDAMIYDFDTTNWRFSASYTL